MGNQNSKTAITVAVISLIGVLGAAILQNDKIADRFFPQKTPSPQISDPSVENGNGTSLAKSEESPEPSQTEIESVIDTSYITFHNAFKNLNKSELQTSFTGEALKSRERLIEANSELSPGEKISIVSIEYDYSNTQFEDYRVINSENVEIKAAKRIKFITFWVDSNRCIAYQPEHTSIQILDLVKTPTGWLISNIKSLHKVPDIVYSSQCPTT
jgi:hypothetical protein